jgi:hypothetical protein
MLDPGSRNSSRMGTDSHNFLEAAMNTLFVSMTLGIGALISAGAYAAAPAGAIAQCKDGTYFTGTEHKGACKGHQGVKEWLDKDKAPATASTTTAASAPANDAATSSKSKKTKKAADTTAATAPAAAATAAPAPATPPVATPPAAAKPLPPPPSTATTPHTPPTPASQIAQKPGGGPGLVWVNSSSKVYHCPGDEWYGKTKEGSYMTEAAAKAAGNHGDHGKECGGK